MAEGHAIVNVAEGLRYALAALRFRAAKDDPVQPFPEHVDVHEARFAQPCSCGSSVIMYRTWFS
jgi:hypothetical protein